MKFTAAGPVLPLHKSITTTSLYGDYTELTHTDDDGSIDSTILSGTELHEALVQLSRAKQGTGTKHISYLELVGHQMQVWGKGNYWRFKHTNKNTTISRGFVVFLLQEILGCPVNRANAIAHESISHFLDLGSQDSSGDRQIRRFRKGAANHITDCYDQLLEQGYEKSASDTVTQLVFMHIIQAFQYIEGKVSLIKSYLLPTPLKMIQSAIMKMSVFQLKTATNKICGHFFNKSCPLTTSI